MEPIKRSTLPFIR